MLEKFYRSLYRIRRVEEEIARIYPTDKIKSPIHLSIGQEAVSVGVCEALRPSDVVFGTYRGHALYLAKGGDLNAMIAELYGKATGCAKGKGGSMHLIDVKAGVMGASAIVASTIPHAVGYAYAEKIMKKDTVVVSFFGDGAVEEGVFHESLNFAGLKQLPVIFVCENNNYAIHSRQIDRQPLQSIRRHADANSVHYKFIKGNNIRSIYEWVKMTAGRIRSGWGPHLLECQTYRWKEHVGPNEDFDAGYRDKEELEYWKETDSLAILAKQLSDDEITWIQMEVEREITEAFEFAEQSPFPEPSALYEDVYA